MAFDPADRVRTFHDAINALDFAAIHDFFAEDAVYVSNGVGSLSGRGDIMAAFRRYFTDYPDQVATDETIEPVTPRAARAVWSLAATHSATGDRLVRKGEETITFDTGGRITRVDVTDYLDF